MPTSIRRLLLSIPALTVAGLVLVYLLFSWFAFEPLVKWAAPRAVADRSAYQLTIEHARFNPFRLAAQLDGVVFSEPGGKPLLSVKQLVANVDTRSLFKRAYVFDQVRISEPVVAVELGANGRLNWLDVADAFAGPPTPKTQGDAQPTRMLLRQLLIERGRIELVDHMVPGGFRTRIDPLDIDLENLSTLPEDRGEHSLSAVTGIGAKIRWKGELGLNPLVARGELAVDDVFLDRLWPYTRQRLKIAQPQGKAAVKLGYHARYAAKVFDLQLDGVEASLEKLVLRGPDDAQPSIALDAVHLSGGRLDLGKREASLDSFSIEGGKLALDLDAQGQPNVLAWLPAAASAPAPAASAAQAPAPWRFSLGRAAVDKLAVRVVSHQFAAPLTAEIGQARLGFKVQGSAGDGPLQLNLEGIGVELGTLTLASVGIAQPWFELASAKVEDGRATLPALDVALGRVAVSGGRINALRDGKGELPLLQALGRAGPPPPPPAQPPQPLHYHVAKLELSDFGVALRDESVSPAASLGLDDITASAENLSDDPKALAPMQLKLRLRHGGRFEASGKVAPTAPSADLQLKLSDLSFTPAQPYVAKSTNVVLAGGQASTQGRLRYQQGQLRYDGGFSLKNLLLNEESSRERFLAWKSLSTTKLTVTPERLQVGELLLDGVDAKVVVFQDRSVNVAKLLKPSSPLAAPAGAASAPPPKKESPGYQVDIERLRVTEGRMDFSDLSLALPFGALIHKLNGQVNGLSSRPGGAAQVQLDGQVDEFGLARAAGQINLFDPTGFTDLKVAFRNVEMTSLTPYSATFAGRKIQSGKLSLDLEYKIKDRQLVGNNQVIMDKLVLGEHIDSPSAANLPLDLALALLKDSEGKIDLGLPVSGSLDDPKFSYGALIWKVFVNVVTKVVTAPFRALGALLGADADKMESVTFDPGRAELLPPEREKLAKLPAVLAKKPELTLTVRGTYNPRSDREAIQELRLRRAVAQQGGRQIGPTEDPGPISLAQPTTREALEKLYTQRFGAKALAEEAARLRGGDLPTLMMQRLLEAEVVDDAALTALAGERAEAIRRELTGRGLAAERMRTEEPKAQEGDGLTVGAALGLDTGGAKGNAAPTTTTSLAR
ncbi:MAG TPA: DUF748 domain-containing protein [Rhizobacter sp.]|nr:DUF748 domain-containing protein [Rhizobacter sp.]